MGVQKIGNWTFRPFVSSPLDDSPPGRFAPLTVSNKKAQLKSDFNQCSQLFKHSHSVDFVNSLYVLYAHNKKVKCQSYS